MHVIRLAVLCLALGASHVAGAQPASTQRLAWLQGCWAAAGTDRVIEEQWMAPRGHAMIGTSRTVASDAVVHYDFMIVREQGDRLAFEVRPTGRAPLTYVSDRFDDSSVVFANAKNEFPQHIGYRRDGPNTVVAWIEGTVQGEPRRVDFRYRQVACAGH
jgi:hypothetical protein